jgi:hypothetical protein
MTDIKLPPMMSHPECHTYVWTDAEKAAIRARDLEVAKLVLEAAAVVAEKYFHTTTAKVIRALEIDHD